MEVNIKYKKTPLYLSHWYRDCAAASKPAEVGLSPTWGTNHSIVKAWST